MDSRIREIEQWIEKAKTGLSDGGREEYVKKLYLLDAEIRAVIKESGTLPGVNHSPERRRSGARRSATRLIAAGVLAGVIVLSAAAAWFANPAYLHTPAEPAAVPAQLADAAGQSRTELAAHIPQMISGEEFVAASWIDTVPFQSAVADVPAGSVDQPLQASGDQLLASAPVLDIGPALRDLAAPPLMPAPPHAGGQSPVILAVNTREQAGGGVQLQPAGFTSAGQVRPASADGKSPAAEPFVAVDIVDNNNPQDSDDVDKLDPDALKRNVEKHFAK